MPGGWRLWVGVVLRVCFACVLRVCVCCCGRACCGKTRCIRSPIKFTTIVFQDMEPPNSILRKGTDMPKPIQRVKFTKAVARHADIRDQNPSRGMICPGEPHQRSPNAPKFEDRSQEETEWRARCPRSSVEAGQKCVKNQRGKIKQHSSHLLKIGACLHQLLNLRNENLLSTPERQCT